MHGITTGTARGRWTQAVNGRAGHRLDCTHGALEGPEGQVGSAVLPERHFYAALMKIVVGVTDNQWAAFLRDRDEITEASGTWIENASTDSPTTETAQ